MSSKRQRSPRKPTVVQAPMIDPTANGVPAHSSLEHVAEMSAASSAAIPPATSPVRGRAPAPARRRLAYGLAAALLVGALGSSAFLFDSGGGANAQAQATPAATAPAPPAMVSVAAVERMALSPQRRVSASVHSRSDARLAADVGGRVLQLAEVGSRLRRGEPLARLDTAALELSVREQQARIGRLQVEAEQAERQRARLRQLGGAGHVSGLQLDEAEARLASLQAQAREAEAGLSQLRLQIERAAPRAPFDGVVVERYAAAGELLAAGAPLLRLVDTADLEIRARAPVALASRLQAGTEVALQVNGREHLLQLGTVVPVGDEVSRQLELRLPLEGLDLPVGSAVELALPTDAAREVLVVPRDAVVLRREGSHVLRVDAENLAQRVAVEVGGSQGDRIEVRGELKPGDRVIVRGGERLREGQSVAILGEQVEGLAVR